MPRTALILLAHGARDPQWAEPLQRVCAAVRDQDPEMRVEPAFLEFMQPDLRACAESLVAEHFERVLVMPMFMASGGHLKRDVPLLLEELRNSHPRTEFAVAAAIGEAESVVQAMARHALTLAGR